MRSTRIPAMNSWDGETDNVACYVRHNGGHQFQVFAINCAHLGCPVRWFPQSQLFMCPCHGGVYYADGARAAGPPERGLFTYEWKIVSGELQIDAGQMPTLSNSAKLVNIQLGQGDSLMPGIKQTASRIYGWIERRVQMEAPVKDAALHPVPRNTASWWYVFGSAAFTLLLSADHDRHPAGAGVCAHRPGRHGTA